MFVAATSNVGKAPASLKLQFGDLVTLQKFDKAWHKVSINHWLNRWVVFDRQKTTESHGSQQNLGLNLAENELKEFLEIRDLKNKAWLIDVLKLECIIGK